jgi:multicomponent K+:H+ antiporter subunit D
VSWAAHLPIVPIALPLFAGALMLLLDERRQALKAAVSLAALVLLLAAAIELARAADRPLAPVYALGAWPAPFGIVLVADRLAALMVLLVSVLALAAFVFSLARWHRAPGRFHSLLQFLVMGLNGAFLTGDLFNLFVFFELLLAASYGLLLHGSGTARVRSGLHYIVVNLAASLLFLVGVSLIYGVTGTLNMAQLAARIPNVALADQALVEAGAAILVVAFMVKAAVWPLGFWLPAAYSAASAPAAARFSVLSKVGVYAVMRLWLLFFGGHEGGALLLCAGLATLAFGMIGMLATQDLGRIAGYSLIASSGTLLAALSRDQGAITAAALLYLVCSTLGVAALFLLVELVQRARAPGADLLAVTAEAFGIEEEDPQEEAGTMIPSTMAILGGSFLACALLLAALPPLPAFVAKATMLAAILAPDPIEPAGWALLAAFMLSTLVMTIALVRAGVAIFWASEERTVPRVMVIEMAPVAGLLFLALALTAAAGPAMRYMNDAANSLHAPRTYVDSVLPRR